MQGDAKAEANEFMLMPLAKAGSEQPQKPFEALNLMDLRKRGKSN